MTAPPARFPFLPVEGAAGSRMPRLPLTLRLGERAVEVVGLLDTGSAVNVLPAGVGLALGARWEDQTTPVVLAGSLGRLDARALIIDAEQPRLAATPVRLVFAWTRADDVPVILGQINFFLSFDVCFFRAEAALEIRPR